MSAKKNFTMPPKKSKMKFIQKRASQPGARQKVVKTAVVKTQKTIDFDAATKKAVIFGNVNDERVASRILEERMQQLVQDGAREITIKSDGQHGMGGRIWPRGETVKIFIEGPVGQRVGSMGM